MPPSKKITANSIIRRNPASATGSVLKRKTVITEPVGNGVQIPPSPSPLPPSPAPPVSSPGINVIGAVAPGIDIPPGILAVNPTARILRPDDLLDITLEFSGLMIEKNDDGTFVAALKNNAQAGCVIVTFQSQNICEQSALEDSANPSAPLPSLPMPVKTRIAGPSRLVFDVPAGSAPIPWNSKSLLDWISNAQLRVPANALPPNPATQSEPPLVSVPIGIGALAGLEVVGVAKTRYPTPSPKSKRPTPTRTAVPTPAQRLAQMRVLSVSSVVREQIASNATDKLISGIIGKFGDQFRLRPTPAQPNATQTAIELPYRLFISPPPGALWTHTVDPAISATTGFVELWHTRLSAPADKGKRTEAQSLLRTVRAIWSPDAQTKPTDAPPFGNLPFFAPIRPDQRHKIVHLSSNFNIKRTDKHGYYEPAAIEVTQLALSTLGANVNMRGAWNIDQVNALDVEEWVQRGTLARDHYVRIVSAGNLLPFGHRASVIEITERKFNNRVAGNPAILYKRKLILVRKPLVLIDNSPFGNIYARQIPFTSARITTLVTPILANTEAPPSRFDALLPEAFWPHVKADGESPEPFLFHLRLEDIDGSPSDIAMPMLFVPKSIIDELKTLKNTTNAKIQKAIAAYNSPKPPLNANGAYGGNAYARVNFAGQRVTYAPYNKPGETVMETATVDFRVQCLSKTLVPLLDSAEVEIPSLKHLASLTAKPRISYLQDYLQNGFGKAGIFAEIKNGVPLDFSTQGDRAGGFVQPNLSITGLSRIMGPVGGTTAALAGMNAGGNFQPKSFFLNAPNPYLFGCIPLSDVFDECGINLTELLPKFVAEELNAALLIAEKLHILKAAVDAHVAKITAAGGQAQIALQKITTAITALGTIPDANGEAGTEFLTTLIGQLVNSTGDASTLLNQIQTNLTQLNDNAHKLLDELPGLIAKPTERRDLETALTTLTNDLADIAKLIGILKNIYAGLTEQRIRFTWKPKIKPWWLNPKPGESPEKYAIFYPNHTDAFTISVTLAAKSETGSDPALDIDCRLEDFDLRIIAPVTFVVLRFRKIEFFAGSGRKPDVNVEFKDEQTERVKGIEFTGPLSFVETLRTLIPLDGLSDPPSLTVNKEGIQAGFSIALPNLAIGVFSLQNLSLGAGFKVPFIGEPLSVSFNFCTRENPFNLSVMMFGGGGFFGITLNPSGIHIFEAALEFGANVSVDFGVASGGVSVMAGLYYKMVDGDASLDGYFRLRGYVSVLAIASASLELYLVLHFETASGKCVGRATITIEISVLCFSASVQVSCEKKFSGANGDPTFIETMTSYTDTLTGDAVNPWDDYCRAFAA